MLVGCVVLSEHNARALTLMCLDQHPQQLIIRDHPPRHGPKYDHPPAIRACGNEWTD